MSGIITKEELKQYIEADLYRYFGDVSTGTYKKTYKYVPGFRFSVWLRRCDYYSKQTRWIRPVFYFARWRYNRLKYKFGFDIEYCTDIGKGFYLGHWGGVVVHPKATIGKNCNISHQVTIGTDIRNGEDAVPKLGDNIYLAPGSKVFGKIYLGNNCVIGANSVVNADVPSGVTVAGMPARVINENDSSDYVRNIN